MRIDGQDIAINRGTARVTDYDKQYCEILKDILNNGELCPNRTGIETLSIPNVNINLNVGEEFPILETKKVAMKNTISELLWIYQAQSNDVSWLHERDNHIWDEWVIDDDGIYRIYDPFIKGNLEKEVPIKNPNGTLVTYPDGEPIKTCGKKEDKTLKDAIYYGEEYAGTIGEAYGYVIGKTKEFDNVLNSLKTNPTNRRMVVSLRHNDFLKKGVLEPCVWSSTYKVHKNKLNSNISIRSNDMPLGNPFNVTQYSILLSILAKTNNLDVGNINFSISDCHIYINQLKGIKLQLERYDRLCRWESFIQTHNDYDIIGEYKELEKKLNYLNKKIKEVPNLKNEYEEILREVNEEIMCLKHLLTRQNPTLYVNSNKDFYKLDNKKNNSDIMILKYTSLPAIKMPVAQ